MTVEHLKPLVKLLTSNVPNRKAEVVAIPVRAMTDPAELRRRYDQLEPLAQQAVQAATHDPKGLLHRDRFIARFGQMPAFHHPAPEAEKRSRFGFAFGFDYRQHERPTNLLLFFPRYSWLPTDVRRLLLDFVPELPPFTLPTQADLPAAITQTSYRWKKGGRVEVNEEVPLRVRETAREAESDLHAVLRLIDMGRLRVTDKKRQPTASSVKAVAEVLQGGDWYAAEDLEQWKEDPASDLTIKAFAWPMIVQAAGLAERSGDRLALTAAGRKALAGRAPEAIRTAFRKWRTSNLLDEFSRIEAIKGQGKGGLSALAPRRKAVLEGLAQCPPGGWFRVEDFFRFLRATGRDFEVSHRPYELYIAEHYYGNLGYDSSTIWEQLQGRYILAVLFEYAATLGLVDVSYIVPQKARNDFRERWGTDDMTCLSRYDGLLYARINPLGAWCMDLAESYEPQAFPAGNVIGVLPNLDVVAKHPPLTMSDRLLLERFAEQTSDAVWRLTAERILGVLEQGGTLDELEGFLSARSGTALPHTVEVLLCDLKKRAGQLRDLGQARLIECADGALAMLLANDPQLRHKCQQAGERWLVFRAEDETAVRRALRRLGHVLPPPG
jgi:hypothetical protein